MRRSDASFSLRLLSAASADRADVNRALAIFIENTSPLLRTKTNQIRTKIASPVTAEGHFYFAALYRKDAVIGFAMFGYYPRSRVLIIDHMVINRDQRGAAAFFIFSQLLHDAIQSLALEVDFAAVELEHGTHYGGEQTGGNELVRLLGQVGFGQVHVDYVIPDIEPTGFKARFPGVLMIRSTQKLYKIRREELLEIVRAILFDHYLPWYRDFFGERTAAYRAYLEELYSRFGEEIRQPVIKVNGPESDGLIPQSAPAADPTAPANLLWYIVVFGATTLIGVGALYVLQPSGLAAVPLLLALLVVFGGVIAASRGRAWDVFDRTMDALHYGKQKSHYQPSSRVSKHARTTRLTKQKTPQGLPGASVDRPDSKGDGSSEPD